MLNRNFVIIHLFDFVFLIFLVSIKNTDQKGPLLTILQNLCLDRLMRFKPLTRNSSKHQLFSFLSFPSIYTDIPDKENMYSTIELVVIEKLRIAEQYWISDFFLFDS